MNNSTNVDLLVAMSVVMALVWGLRRLLDVPRRLPRWDRPLRWLWAPAVLAYVVTAALHYKSPWFSAVYLALGLGVGVAALGQLRHYRPARTVLLALVPIVAHAIITRYLLLSGRHLLPPYATLFKSWGEVNIFLLIALFAVANSQKKNVLQEEQRRAEEERERERIATQNAELERLVAERSATLTQQANELQKALNELQATQTQLIQSEKMASLGELTAGIAHEIQNPLNFVNNFADVSAELVAELEEEQTRPAPDSGLEDELLADLKQNLLKISQHGQRASSIVKGMLAHSRTSTGERQPIDLNNLADEFLRLSYHGLRAKDKTFNATLQTEFAPILPLVQGVGQDLGRVLLNLFNNAFYAVQKRQQAGEPGYQPTVRVSTRRCGSEVELCVRDNGTGIPVAARDKIFQPFFTTKPAGEGTGLGLSLSHDIVAQGHGGTLTVTSKEGEFTEFVVRIPF